MGYCKPRNVNVCTVFRKVEIAFIGINNKSIYIDASYRLEVPKKLFSLLEYYFLVAVNGNDAKIARYLMKE